MTYRKKIIVGAEGYHATRRSKGSPNFEGAKNRLPGDLADRVLTPGIAGETDQRKSLTVTEAKQAWLGLVAEGVPEIQAAVSVGRRPESIRQWRKRDPDFARLSMLARAGTRSAHLYRADVKDNCPDFPAFCEKYLGIRLWPHQLQWFDMLEGRKPRDLHPAQRFEEGRPNRLLVNTPPGHSKSMTITISYVTWRLVRDPDLKVLIVSKSQGLAKQFLLAIQERLTSPQYKKLADELGPPGGWKKDSAGWTANLMYLSRSVRDATEKDPSVQAVGIGGQIYGIRSDLVIVDDAVDNLNAGKFEDQTNWLLGILSSRLQPRSGRCLVVGTRIASRDMYSELLDPGRYHGLKSPWTALTQPAVLEYAEKAEDWVTLWPRSDLPFDSDQEADADGLYSRWDGPTLAEVRAQTPPAEWSRLYMQQQIAGDSLFTSDVLTASLGGYKPGRIPDTHAGRNGGMEGLRVIAGLDPAMSGYTAAVVLGFDTRTDQRFVLDCFNKARCSPDDLRELIYAWTDRYSVDEWRVESNAFQGFLVQDAQVRDFLATRHVVMTGHYTTHSNKMDPSFGVAAMAGVFAQDMVVLPRPVTEPVRQLMDQLQTWSAEESRRSQGGTKAGTAGRMHWDLVMALWFAMLRAAELSREASGDLYATGNPFLTPADRRRQRVLVFE